MSRRGQISIDKIVAVRSSVLPLYVIIRNDGSVTAVDEVSEDGNDFLTTKMIGDQICFRSIRGDYLSTEGGKVSSRRYCSADERFAVEKRDTQYAFRARSGKYLSVMDRHPYVSLAASADETEVFQLFSLMMCGVNVGKHLEVLERSSSVMIDGVLDDEQVEELRAAIIENGGCGGAEAPKSHEVRVSGLIGRGDCFAGLATHPVILQLVRRLLSPSVKISDVESCRTYAEFVRKELEVTSWNVVHPYSSVDFPGVVDPRINFTATWFLDSLDATNSTWAWAKAPHADGAHLPMLPQLSSPEEVAAVIKTSKPIIANRGSVWLYIGPMWLSNSVGAASFWKDYDAQTRYKHLSGQKEQAQQTFRALTDAQRSAPQKEELCPIILQTNYVREYVASRDPTPCSAAFANLSELQRRELESLLA